MHWLIRPEGLKINILATTQKKIENSSKPILADPSNQAVKYFGIHIRISPLIT